MIATGSAPFIHSRRRQGSAGCRHLPRHRRCGHDDRARAGAGAKAVVIGGGLLGLEAAAALRLGAAWTSVVLHLMGHMMERQLDPAAGAIAEARARRSAASGSTARHRPRRILGNDHVEAVALDDGTIYPADLVVMAVGIRPKTRMATDAGLHVERGIVVDDQMRDRRPAHLRARANVPNIEGVVYGLVAPLYDMAEVPRGACSPARTPRWLPAGRMSTRLKVTGINALLGGRLRHRARTAKTSCCATRAPASIARLVVKDGQLIGAVLYGDTGRWPLVLRQAAQSAARSTPTRNTPHLRPALRWNVGL